MALWPGLSETRLLLGYPACLIPATKKS